MKYPFLKHSLALALASTIASPTLLAATYTWNVNGGASGPLDGSGTWTAATLFWNGSANASIPTAPTVADGITIGNTTGGYTVTVDGGGSFLNYTSGTTVSDTLNVNQNYTIAANAVGDGLSIGNINLAAGKTVTISAGIDRGTNTGTKTWNVNNGATLNLSGGGRIQNLNLVSGSTSGQVNLTGGTWINDGAYGIAGSAASTFTVTNSGATVSTIGSYTLGSGLNNAGAVFNYQQSGGSLSGSNLGVGLGVTSGVIGNANMTVSGGSVTLTGKLSVGTQSSGKSANGTLSVSAGTVSAANALFLGTNEDATVATSSTVNISGGTVNANLTFGDNGTARTFTAGSTATVNLTGGAWNLNLVSLNGTQANLARTVNLGGGTLGAKGGNVTIGTSNAVAFVLTGTNGNVTIKASDTDNTTARNFTFNDNISGVGGITKTGGGTLALNGTNNTFTGGLIVNAGSVTTNATSSFGAGSVTVGGGSITLGNFSSISDTGTLSVAVGTTVALNFGTTGTETVFSLYNSTSDVWVTPGTYTAAQLNSLFFGGNTVFTSTNAANNLVTVTAVPEPTTWSLIGIFLLGLTVVRVRNRRRQLA